MTRYRRLSALAGAVVMTAATGATAQEARACDSAAGGAGPAQTAAKAFIDSLGPAQKMFVVRGYNKPAATRWSNLPIALAPRVGVRLGDLNEAQTVAANALLKTALSSCGVELLDGIRAADAVLKPLDNRGIGWDPANY